MDFEKALETWQNVLFRPSEETFAMEREKDQANFGTAIIWVLAATVVAAFLSAIGGVVGTFVQGSSLAALEPFLIEMGMSPREVAELMAMQGGGVASAAFGGFCGALIGIPIFYFIYGTILFLAAKLFGGTGEFEEHMYMLSTFLAPLYVVNGALSIIPFLGACLSFLVTIYQIVLASFAMKATHQFGMGAAVTVALTPLILILLCTCVVVLVVVAIIGAAASDPNAFQ